MATVDLVLGSRGPLGQGVRHGRLRMQPPVLLATGRVEA